MGMWWSLGRDHYAKRVVESVVAAFNARDFAAMRQAVAPDFKLMDSMGVSVSGRDEVITLLLQLAAYDPQFRMHVEEITGYADYVLMSGHTTGSYQLSGQQRTLWKILLQDGLLVEWRSYSAESSQLFVRLLAGAQGSASVAMAEVKHA